MNNHQLYLWPRLYFEDKTLHLHLAQAKPTKSCTWDCNNTREPTTRARPTIPDLPCPTSSFNSRLSKNLFGLSKELWWIHSRDCFYVRLIFRPRHVYSKTFYSYYRSICVYVYNQYYNYDFWNICVIEGYLTKTNFKKMFEMVQCRFTYL